MYVTTHSLGEFCPVVKAPFTIPSVVQRQRAQSYKAIFLCLYQSADERGLVELDAERIANAVGLSRKTIYKVISFLKRVNLIRLLESRRGRGKHSLYRLNWRKPKGQSQEKCHRPLPYKVTLKNIHPTGDSLAMDSILTPTNPILWKRCMRAFRGLLKQSQIGRAEQRLCIGALGRKLRDKERSFGLKLYKSLETAVRQLRVPEWAKSPQKVCAWFMGLIKAMFQPKPRHESMRFEDINEHLWELARQERARVMAKRAPYEKSWEERLEEWKRDTAPSKRGEVDLELHQGDPRGASWRFNLICNSRLKRCLNLRVKMSR